MSRIIIFYVFLVKTKPLQFAKLKLEANIHLVHEVLI